MFILYLPPHVTFSGIPNITLIGPFINADRSSFWNGLKCRWYHFSVINNIKVIVLDRTVHQFLTETMMFVSFVGFLCCCLLSFYFFLQILMLEMLMRLLKFVSLDIFAQRFNVNTRKLVMWTTSLGTRQFCFGDTARWLVRIGVLPTPCKVLTKPAFRPVFRRVIMCHWRLVPFQNVVKIYAIRVL